MLTLADVRSHIQLQLLTARPGSLVHLGLAPDPQMSPPLTQEVEEEDCRGRRRHKMQMQPRLLLQIKCQDIKYCHFHFAGGKMTNPYSPLNKLWAPPTVIMAEQSAVINDSNLLYLAAGAGGEQRRRGYHNSYRK